MDFVLVVGGRINKMIVVKRSLFIVALWLLQISLFKSELTSSVHIAYCEFGDDKSHISFVCSEHDHSSGVYEQIQSNDFVYCGPSYEYLNETRVIKFINCEFTEYPHNLLQRFEYVQEIYLPTNRISSMDGSIFTNSTHLDTLDLSHNWINTVSPAMFFGLSNLKELSLRFNKIKHIPRKTFLLFRNLVELDLSWNLINSIEAPMFIEQNRLQRLDLSFSNITELGIGAFLYLNQLTYLSMSHSNLTYIDRLQFVPLSSLETLDLSFNRFMQITFNPWSLNSLKALYLNNNELTKLDGLYVSQYSFSSLKILRIVGNRFNCPYLEELLQSSRLSELDIDVNELNFNEPHCIRSEVLPIDQGTTSNWATDLVVVSTVEYDPNDKDVRSTQSPSSDDNIHNNQQFHRIDDITKNVPFLQAVTDNIPVYTDGMTEHITKAGPATMDTRIANENKNVDVEAPSLDKYHLLEFLRNHSHEQTKKELLQTGLWLLFLFGIIVFVGVLVFINRQRTYTLKKRAELPAIEYRVTNVLPAFGRMDRALQANVQCTSSSVSECEQNAMTEICFDDVLDEKMKL